MWADLHVHTTVSDGTLTPEEVVARAGARGLGAVAITDHDTMLGIGRAWRAGRRHQVKVIPGIELSTETVLGELHILGYYLDWTREELRRQLQGLHGARCLRIMEMTRRLNRLGFRVSWERVQKIAGRGSVGRPHLAEVLVEEGYADSIANAFSQLLGQNCPAYVPRPKLSPAEAITLIRGSGGVAVLAHPGRIERATVAQLVNLGLGGLEVYYPRHDAFTTRRLFRLAAAYGLLVTGGSDFHGDRRTATGIGAAGVSRGELQRLCAFATGGRPN